MQAGVTIDNGASIATSTTILPGVATSADARVGAGAAVI